VAEGHWDLKVVADVAVTLIEAATVALIGRHGNFETGIANMMIITVDLGVSMRSRIVTDCGHH
jgi:hypothetical protein